MSKSSKAKRTPEPEEFAARLERIRATARGAPTGAGVYRLLDEDGDPLYIGKAGNLRARLATHFSGRASNARLTAMLSRVASFDVSPTESEVEALLLEDQLVKEHMPPYNVLLRDDKSFPWVQMTEHEFPAIRLHRGPRKKGRFFGPWPSAKSVRLSLRHVQQLFGIRTCSDTEFRNRSRPCLEYDIGRCSGPCVGHIGAEEYAGDCADAARLLRGDGAELLNVLGEDMRAAAHELNYERAARLRERQQLLSGLQSSQAVAGEGGSADLMVCVQQGQDFSIGTLAVRDGAVVDTQSHLPRVPANIRDPAEVLAAYALRWYLSPGMQLSSRLYLDPLPDDAAQIAAALDSRLGYRVRVLSARRDPARSWKRVARERAEEGLQQSRRDSRLWLERWEELVRTLGWEGGHGGVECMDASHHMGERSLVSCVAFDMRGPRSRDWRTYLISGKDHKPGDDYAALAEAVGRRYGGGKPFAVPRLLLIDGGQGQVNRVRAALDGLGQPGPQLLLGIAKGPSRRAGLERFVADNGAELGLPPRHGARLLLQHVRDEAHRFAITAVRKGMRKSRKTSELEAIPGVGSHTRRVLLNWFGGWKGVQSASVGELCKVPGIGPARAEALRVHFRSQGG